MKYLLYIAVVSFMIVSCDVLSSPSQANYRSHTVQKGETVYSIAKKYGTTRKEIYLLNPDAKNGVKENAVLVIPSTDVINSSGAVTFKTHKVRRKETLFSIAQLYNVSVEDIKRYNKHLYAKQLKKGEKLQIPKSVNANNTTGETNTTSETSNTGSDSKSYKVKPKETKFGIARMYGITIAELEALNPNLGESLQIGETIQVPSESVTNEATLDTEKYTFYEVQPKEGFYRLKVKLGLSEEEIVSLNPYAKEGLKEGMILKIPKDEVASNDTVSTVNLETGLSNKSEKRIAIMLPFLLNRAQGDSVNNSEILKNERTMRIALDFYSGVLMATEFAKDQGISVTVDVFDTQASAGKVGSIISSNNFDTVDAVIGPLLSSNVEKAAAALKGEDVPVFFTTK
ncbi:LysM peptidoglycan-binding domain-containing protein [Rasiella rasia]|uniref:LysM peptidoglycan-binding domain-containing protein n=1 Tax=Rasiella rasia TaxID=2744027 RepID=A0A6G6GKG6_9FLAO|nr:LysM peptidoglycan-binding domain-containing protein [Rasiella rasia]QIE58980.1 LysM peptidoglycan-binding domain-containing protein [Rasiella rasia]